MKVDTSELTRLANDMTSAGARLNRAVLPIMKRAGGNIQRDAQTRVKAKMFHRARTRLPHYPRSITFTTTQTGGSTQTDVGPESDRKQGPLGKGVEYGSVKTPAIPHMIPALDAEVSNATKYLLDAASNLLRR